MSLKCKTIGLDLGLEPKARYAGLPRDAIEGSKNLMEALGGGGLRPGLLAKVSMSRFELEAEAIAEAHGVTYSAVMGANLSYEAMLGMGCSTIAIPTDNGPAIVRNMDWIPETLLARASRLLMFHRGGRFEFANAGFSGSIGAVTGMSSRGFGVALNAVFSEEGLDLSGFPVLFMVRTVLEDARDFKDAMDRLMNQKLTLAAMFTLVGTENDERVVIERTPSRGVLRRASGSDPLFTTNHYRAMARPEHCPRYDRLSELVVAKRRSSSDPAFQMDMLKILTDEGVRQEITSQHVILCPRLGSIHMYVPFKLISA
jgi:predicted choloylglycine hydrolase